MIICGDLAFKECCCPLWVRRDDETGQIESTFWTESGAEMNLSFDPGSFEKFASMMDEFQKKGETQRNVGREETGSVESSLSLDLGNEEIRFNVNLTGSLEENEIEHDLIIAGKDFKLSLGFNLNQAREIKKRLEEVVSILEGIEKVQEEKILPARA